MLWHCWLDVRKGIRPVNEGWCYTQDGPAYNHLSYVIDACLMAIFKNNQGKVDTIPDFIAGAKDNGNGGDNWSYNTCKAPAKSSPPTNQHPTFLQVGCPSCHPTNSVKAPKGNFGKWNWREHMSYAIDIQNSLLLLDTIRIIYFLVKSVSQWHLDLPVTITLNCQYVSSKYTSSFIARSLFTVVLNG